MSLTDCTIPSTPPDFMTIAFGIYRSFIVFFQPKKKILASCIKFIHPKINYLPCNKINVIKSFFSLYCNSIRGVITKVERGKIEL